MPRKINWPKVKQLLAERAKLLENQPAIEIKRKILGAMEEKAAGRKFTPAVFNEAMSAIAAVNHLDHIPTKSELRRLYEAYDAILGDLEQMED